MPGVEPGRRKPSAMTSQVPAFTSAVSNMPAGAFSAQFGQYKSSKMVSLSYWCGRVGIVVERGEAWWCGAGYGGCVGGWGAVRGGGGGSLH